MLNSERFSALYVRDFRLFWFGQLISFSGTWMHSTAQGWLVYSLTKSPFYLGMVSAVSSLPILFFSLFGGVAADRFRKRNLLLLTQALSIIPAFLIGVLASFGVIQIWHVMTLVFMLGVINAFDVPARQSFLIEMVEREKLLNAIALNSAAFNGARLIGPVLAGMIIAHLGLPACFYINALSFFAVLVALSQMKVKGERKGARGNILKEISAGMAFIKRSPEVMRPMLLVAAFSLFGLPFIALLPVFAAEVLNVGARGLGFLLGASGIGALTSALVIAIKGDVKMKKEIMGIASITFPISLILFASSGSYVFSLFMMSAIGLSVVALLATANSAIQLCTPDELRGRVMSVFTLVFLGITPIGNSAIGIIANMIGTVNAVRGAAAICLGISIIIVFAERKR